MAEEKEAANNNNKKARRPSAQKRDLQHEKRRLQNKAFKARVNTAIRTFKNSVTAEPAAASESLKSVYSLMDKGVKTGVYKLNKAARVKSRLYKLSRV